MTHRHLIGLLGSVLLVLGGAACGNTGASSDEPSVSAPASDSSSATPGNSPSPTAIDGPDCDAVWVTGKTLPADYEYCIDATGTVIEDELIECSSGQVIVVHDSRQYAVAGGKIAAAANVDKDPRFRKILRVCKG